MTKKSPKDAFDRRTFLKTASATSSIVVAPAFIKTALGDGSNLNSDLFALGVASGDPGRHSVVLWTRLVGDPLTGQGLPDEPIELQWEIATDPGMVNIINGDRIVADPRDGHAVRVLARRLPACRWYYYQFRALGKFKGHQSRVGRTRTFPRRFGDGNAQCRSDEMRFAFVSCQNYTQGFFAAWNDVAQQDIDFVVHTGDYIYENGATSTPIFPDRNHIGSEIFSVEEYRNRYALYRLDQDLQEAHAQFPFIVTWDDHEVDNNYAKNQAEEGAPFQDEAFIERKRNAYQVFAESMPIRRRFSDRSGRLSLARRIQFGRLADFHVLDTRQFRSDQPAGDGFGSTDENVDPTTAAILEDVFGQTLFDASGIENPRASLLGFGQEIWLAKNLIFSRSHWNVLAQQIMVMPWNLRETGRLSVQFGPDFDGKDQVLAAIGNLENILNVDAWDGYPASRRRLLRLLDLARPNNPIVLTGDIHSAWAAHLLEDFEDPGNSEILATEFVCTSVSSTFASVDPRPTDSIVNAGIPDNPHIRLFDGRFRGYCLCDVTRQRWKTTYRGVGSAGNLLNPDPLALVPKADDPSFTVAEAEIQTGFNRRRNRKDLSIVEHVPRSV